MENGGTCDLMRYIEVNGRTFRPDLRQHVKIIPFFLFSPYSYCYFIQYCMHDALIEPGTVGSIELVGVLYSMRPYNPNCWNRIGLHFLNIFVLSTIFLCVCKYKYTWSISSTNRFKINNFYMNHGLFTSNNIIPMSYRQ